VNLIHREITTCKLALAKSRDAPCPAARFLIKRMGRIESKDDRLTFLSHRKPACDHLGASPA